MPRVNLTDEEAALIDKHRHEQGLVRKGQLQALNIVQACWANRQTGDAEKVYDLTVAAIENLIKGTR